MNMQKLMAQAQKMQSNLAKAQEELKERTVTITSAGDKIKVIASCAGDIHAIEIDPVLVDPEDVDFLQDAVTKAVQEAIVKGREVNEQEMKKLTGGMNLPGM